MHGLCPPSSSELRSVIRSIPAAVPPQSHGVPAKWRSGDGQWIDPIGRREWYATRKGRLTRDNMNWEAKHEAHLSLSSSFIQPTPNYRYHYLSKFFPKDINMSRSELLTTVRRKMEHVVHSDDSC